MKYFTSLNGYTVKDGEGREALSMETQIRQAESEHTAEEIENLKTNRVFTKSILDFGADNTGSVDIRPAIVAAQSAGVTQLYFPPGTYRCGSDIRDIPMNYIAGDNVQFTGVYYHLFNIEGSIKFADCVGGEKWSSWAMKRITTDFTGGAGRVGSALQVRTEAKNEGSFEWNILGILDNFSDTGENCSAYFQANKSGQGATWGACVEAIQKTRVQNPTSGLVGLEVDVSADEVDENYNRVGIDIYMRGYLGGSTTQNQYGYGIRINSHEGITFHGLSLRGNFSRGIDLSTGSYANEAIKFGNANKLRWNTIDLYGSEETFCFDIGTNRIFEVKPSGANLAGTLTAGKISVNGVSITGTLKGSSVSALAENAIEVEIGGAKYYLPIYTG